MSSGAQAKQAKAVEAGQQLSVRELSAAERGVLRFITCGSVDDGKSTLIGRLLYDTKLLFEDQLAALERDSARHGTQGANMDFALLLDGLEAEREQGITIDVAYRYFATDKRKFIVADTPGHEQYTRNMATGASTADAAVILVDARKGVLTQTRRHTFITHMVGVRHIVLAVNKMDLVEDRQAEFDRIVAEYRGIADKLGFESVQAIPISALNGDNVIAPSENMAWYDGPTLLTYLEDLGGGDAQSEAPFRMPVQWVNRPNLDFRGFSGQVTSGVIAPGDDVVVARSGRPSRIKEISTADGPLDRAEAGDAVTLVLEDEIDVSRGDVLARPDSRPDVSGNFAARVLWMHENGMSAGRSYLMKVGAQVVQATLKKIEHRIDVNTMDETEADALQLNEIGLCELTTNQPIVFDPYEQIRESGAFILVDRYSNQTVGAGMIERSLSRATNVHQHAMDVTQADRARAYGHRPAILWFTGLSGSGKSTIANLVERRLSQMGAHTYALDGDNMRGGLNKDLGFTDSDRVENIRRVGEVARLFVDAGTIVTASFISPFKSERDLVRSLVKEGEYIEIFVDTPITICAQRDPKGLYKKAMAGEIKNFTGIDSPYEPPENPELILETTQEPPEASVDKVIGYLRERGILSMGGGGTVGFSI